MCILCDKVHCVQKKCTWQILTCIYFISFRYHRQEMSKYNLSSQLETDTIIVNVLCRWYSEQYSKNLEKLILEQVSEERHSWDELMISDITNSRPGFDPGYRRGGDFLRSFVFRLVLQSTQPPINWVTGAFPGGKRRPSVGLATLPLLSDVAVYMLNFAYTSPWAFTICIGDNFTFSLWIIMSWSKIDMFQLWNGKIGHNAINRVLKGIIKLDWINWFLRAVILLPGERN